MAQRVTPQLRMTDWARTRAFYVDGLGFSVDWEHRFEPGFPVFAQVTRAGLSLFLTEHAGDCQPGGAAYLVVDDLDALFREISERGVRPTEPPADTPWGTREMTVVDPDGNRLRFGDLVKAEPKASPSATHPTPQPLICVSDVEAASRWYQRLLNLQSAHGGPHYERLTRDGRLVMQLHHWEVEHHHGPIGDRATRPYGNGVLLWFEVDDFDAAVTRAGELQADVVKPKHRNPPTGPGGPNHWECWLRDPEGYTIVLASPDGSAGDLQ